MQLSADRLPDPLVAGLPNEESVRQRLGAVLREASLLRSLLRLARRAQAELAGHAGRATVRTHKPTTRA